MVKILNQNKFLIFSSLVLYTSLLVGFFLGEDLNSGAAQDWYKTDYPVIRDLTISIKQTLLNYESYGHRHSPLYLIFLSLFTKIGLSFDLVRFLHLNLSLFLIYYFYKCLVLQFEKVERNIIILLSISIFLSPTFRSLSIWPSTTIIGLIFFLISIYEFLKFKKKQTVGKAYKNFFYLILASYISPNFSLFAVYFFYYYLKKLDFKNVFYLFIFGLVLSIPAFYYVFILGINFISPGSEIGVIQDTNKLSFNISNKILIIGSILFFHLIPLIINKKLILEIIHPLKKTLFSVFMFLIINIYFFNYNLDFTGGGIFLQISNIFFNNNLFFYASCFISLIILGALIKKNFNNFLIIFLLVISNIQYTIYHKYYEPLFLILFFTILDNRFKIKFFEKKINLFYLYLFSFFYIFIRVFKSLYFI